MELHVHPQPGVRCWGPIASGSDDSSFLKLLLAFYLAGLSSHARHGRKILSFLHPEKVHSHIILPGGCPKRRAAEEAKHHLPQPRQGHSSQGDAPDKIKILKQVSLVKASPWSALKTVTHLDVLVKRHLIST